MHSRQLTGNPDREEGRVGADVFGARLNGTNGAA